MARSLPLLDVPSSESEDAGLGALETQRGCLPLAAVDVRAAVAGLLAHTSVRQTFRNSFDTPLEATYVFPLPDRAAVTRFRMTVGERVVEGELKERSQARQDYADAIQKGHRAALAEEDRSGVFTMQVGNIPPGEEITIELELIGPLELNDDEATYRFPLVVAPRYTPGVPLDGVAVGAGVAPDTDQVPDASRVTPPVLLPGFPNPVRLSLEVTLDPAGLKADLSRVRSSLHSVVLDEQGPPWTILLQPGERLNRDFILRFPVVVDRIQTTLQCSPASPDKPSVFGVTLVPPATSAKKPKPREVVFVLDRSGSMDGWKMVAARRALGRMIDTLLDEDRFTVIAFDDETETPPPWDGAAKRDKLFPGTNRHRWRVLEWLGKIDARGGTEMGPALKSALQCFSRPSTVVDRVLAVVTDGQITGEDALLRTLKKAARGAMPRVFTLGIDQAVNAAFLRRLADLGGGVCDLVESEDRLDESLDRVHRLIGQPVLTDVRLELIDFDGVVDSLAPARTAGLYAGRPLMIFGRHLAETTPVRIRVCATDAAGRPWATEVTSQDASPTVLLHLWGRAQVRELEDRYAANGNYDEKLAERIVQTSLESGVLSRFTAYVAVDKSEIVNAGGQQQHVIQPVELPAGWAIDLPTVAFCMAPPPAKASRNIHSLYIREEVESVTSNLQNFEDEDTIKLDTVKLDDIVLDAPDLGDDKDIEKEIHVSCVAKFLQMASDLLRKLTGRKEKAANLTALDHAIRNLLDALEGRSLSQDELARLTQVLEDLAAFLMQANHPAKDEIARLAAQGRALLEVWIQTADEANIEVQLSVFLNDAEAKLQSLLPPPPRSAGSFWKTTDASTD